MGEEEYYGFRRRSETGHGVRRIGGIVGGEFSAGIAAGERVISAGDRRKRRQLRARGNAGGYGARRSEILAGRIARQAGRGSVEDGNYRSSGRGRMGCAEQRFEHFRARQAER